MKLFYPQLQDHLRKKNLLAMYFISSDEYLLSQEAVTAIRQTAVSLGFSERVSIVAESQQDWIEPLMASMRNLSLFSDKKIIELNLTQINVNATLGKAISDALLYLSDSILLVITTSKCDAKSEKSAWHQAIEKKGAMLAIWPIPPEQLPSWIMQRAKQSHISLTPIAAEQLVRLTEGNLLAADQAIQKLALMTSGETVDHTMVASFISDDSRFGLFDIIDCALMGEKARCIRVLKSIEQDAIEPTLVLWVLTREVRFISTIHQQLKQSVPLSQIFQKERVLSKRQAPIRACLQRYSEKHCEQSLLHASHIDRIIKGVSIGDTWRELEKMTLHLAGAL